MFAPEPPSHVDEGVWTGGWPTAEAAAALRDAGVTHVLNVSTEPSDPARLPGARTAWAPTVDSLLPQPASWYRRGLSFARRALAEPSNVLYVHCQEGRHRGPLMTYVILRALRGLPPPAARRAITSRRAAADFPRVYLQSAEAFLREEADGPAASDAATARG